MWLRRARWRLRGAWQAPAFVVFTIAGTLILELLPLAGDDGPGLIGAFLIAGFVNLFGLAVLGPLIGLWLNRRSGDRPPFAARDRGGVYALAGLCALLVAAGLAHRPALKQGQDRKSTRLNSSHLEQSRMPSSA